MGRELPEVEEATWYNTPSLKVKGKGFARLRSEAEGGLVFYADLDEKAALLASGDSTFYTTPHYDGYGSILVDLDRVYPDGARGAARGSHGGARRRPANCGRPSTPTPAWTHQSSGPPSAGYSAAATTSPADHERLDRCQSWRQPLIGARLAGDHPHGPSDRSGRRRRPQGRTQCLTPRRGDQLDGQPFRSRRSQGLQQVVRARYVGLRGRVLDVDRA